MMPFAYRTHPDACGRIRTHPDASGRKPDANRTHVRHGQRPRKECDFPHKDCQFPHKDYQFPHKDRGLHNKGELAEETM